MTIPDPRFADKGSGRHSDRVDRRPVIRQPRAESWKEMGIDPFRHNGNAGAGLAKARLRRRDGVTSVGIVIENEAFRGRE